MTCLTNERRKNHQTYSVRELIADNYNLGNPQLQYCVQAGHEGAGNLSGKLGGTCHRLFQMEKQPACCFKTG